MLPGLLGAAAVAQTPPPAALRDPADRVFREQAERERERNVERAAPLAGRAGAEPQAPAGFPVDLPVDGPRFPIHTIAARGDTLLDAGAFARITAPFVDQPLAAAHIRVLIERLNQALAAQGYFTSKAMVANQNLAEGRLTIDFMAGRVERIVFDGKDVGADAAGGWASLGIRMALPFSRGDVLKLQDVEQAVDQFNRVRGNNVQVQIQPGTEIGGSVVRFQNTPGAHRQFMLSLDNQGGAATGRWRTQASVEQGNALGLMETLSLGLTTSRDTNAVFGTASVPFGNNTVSVMGSWSEYLNLVGDTALVYGTSRNTSVAFNHLLKRDQTSKTALDLSLARRSSGRSINNAALTPQQLTVVRLGVNRLTRSADGGQWTVDGAWVQGLSALGALRDADDLPSGAARAQFSKVEVSASRVLSLTSGLFQDVKGVSWRARVNAQWSRDALYSSEQIFAGGVGSVRGFAESAVGGDRGVVIRNELVREGWWLATDGRARLDPYAFVDAAHVRSVSGGGQSLASVGAGMRISFLRGSTQGSADLVVGRPIKRPHTPTADAPSVSINLSFFF